MTQEKILQLIADGNLCKANEVLGGDRETLRKLSFWRGYEQCLIHYDKKFKDGVIRVRNKNLESISRKLIAEARKIK